VLLEQYRSDQEAASKLIAVGDSPPDPSLDPAELAAYTGLASLILNLDEVITKESGALAAENADIAET
jgi:hypothetical protein